MHRGDILTLVGRTQDIAAATKTFGYPDRATDVADVAFIGAAITIGALLGAIVYKIGKRAAHAIDLRRRVDRRPDLRMAALGASDLRPHPFADRLVHEFGRPEHVHRRGRHLVRARLRRRPAAAWLQPVPLGRRGDDGAAASWRCTSASTCSSFDDAIVLGCCSGARTTTASLGMVYDRAKSQIPGLGYTVTYAVGNTLLTIWGMVIVMLLT